MLRAAQGSQTAAAIGKAFAKEGYIIGNDTAQMIRQLYKDVAAIPTGYFEAKPQRAVGFDEVKAAVLPDNASETLVNSLKEQGVPVYQYKAGDDAKRTEILNKLPNVRFRRPSRPTGRQKQNQQRQASRVLAEKAAAFDTLNQFFGLTKNTRLSDAALESLAIRWTKTNGSRADRTKLANETRALVEYLRSEGADMAKAQGLAETLAGEVLDEATDRNTELWDEYPDLHDPDLHGRQERQSQGRACEAVRKLDRGGGRGPAPRREAAAGGGIPGRQPGGTVRVHRERHPGRGRREGERCGTLSARRHRKRAWRAQPAWRARNGSTC